LPSLFHTVQTKKNINSKIPPHIVLSSNKHKYKHEDINITVPIAICLIQNEFVSSKTVDITHEKLQQMLQKPRHVNSPLLSNQKDVEVYADVSSILQVDRIKSEVNSDDSKVYEMNNTVMNGWEDLLKKSGLNKDCTIVIRPDGHVTSIHQSQENICDIIISINDALIKS
jgi:hypothetical protein